MISFDFEYYRPSSIEEAITTFKNVRADQRVPLYFGGGTEFISRARIDELAVDAVIDLKGIPECNELTIRQNQIRIGSAITLSSAGDSNFFPLLSDVIHHIATRTARNKITVGGNIASHLFYKEALLPFLLADSKVVIAGKEGVRTEPLDVFSEKAVPYKDEEFIVQLITDHAHAGAQHGYIRKTKHFHVNYPIVSVAYMLVDGQIRAAFSGVCTFPFRSKPIEQALNASGNGDKRILKVIKNMPTVLEDMLASRSYRKFALQQTLTQILESV